MDFRELPQLKVNGVDAKAVRAVFDPSPWIGEGWIGWVFSDEDRRAIPGRFREVNAYEATCVFVPDDANELCHLSSGTSLRYLDGYWGDRAELVLNKELRWSARVFEASDAVRIGSRVRKRDALETGEGTIVPGGWNHEHCEICWATLGPGTRMVTNQRDEIICVSCHEGYVATGSLEFVPAA